jgi:hypothetical protein
MRRALLAAVLTSAALVVPTVAAPSADAASAGVWNRIAACESGGRWHISTGNGYYGGLQFSSGTWAGYGGHRYASQANRASKRQQIRIGTRVQHHQGWGAWPRCAAFMR